MAERRSPASHFTLSRTVQEAHRTFQRITYNILSLLVPVVRRERLHRLPSIIQRLYDFLGYAIPNR